MFLCFIQYVEIHVKKKKKKDLHVVLMQLANLRGLIKCHGYTNAEKRIENKILNNINMLASTGSENWFLGLYQ